MMHNGQREKTESRSASGSTRITLLFISFEKVEGFEERIFPDHDKMMETVFHMGSSGYRFQ